MPGAQRKPGASFKSTVGRAEIFQFHGLDVNRFGFVLSKRGSNAGISGQNRTFPDPHAAGKRTPAAADSSCSAQRIRGGAGTLCRGVKLGTLLRHFDNLSAGKLTAGWLRSFKTRSF
jgi:hypothetical protein